MPEILESQPLTRVFKFEREGRTIELEDFNPLASPQEIIKFHAGMYPELTNSKIDPPKYEGSNIIFNIGEEAGTLG
jgi:PRTRC genetic system protein C